MYVCMYYKQKVKRLQDAICRGYPYSVFNDDNPANVPFWIAVMLLLCRSLTTKELVISEATYQHPYVQFLNTVTSVNF